MREMYNIFYIAYDQKTSLDVVIVTSLLNKIAAKYLSIDYLRWLVIEALSLYSIAYIT